MVTGAPKDGHYYAMVTLLAGNNNRRTIYRWPDDEPVATFNASMREWTPKMERQLKLCLSALNNNPQFIDEG